MSDRRYITDDGVEVKRGDTVWIARKYGYPREVKLDTSHMYWISLGPANEYFSSEQLALAAALKHARQSLKRARGEVRTQTRRVAVLASRLDSARCKP